MIQWNERKNNQQNLKTTVIKLSSLEKRTAKNDQEIVYLRGEDKDEVFSNFMSVWRKQGISLDSLNYGDELLVRWRPSTGSNGFVYKNFVEVFTKKTVTLSQLTHEALQRKDLDKWDPHEEVQDVDMSDWETE